MIANDLQKKERYAKPQRKNQQFLTSKLKKNISSLSKGNTIKQTFIFIKSLKLFGQLLSLFSLRCRLHCSGLLFCSLGFNPCYEPFTLKPNKFQQIPHYLGLIMFIAETATIHASPD